MAANTSRPAAPPMTKAPSERSEPAPAGRGSDIDHLEVADGALEAAFVDVDEEEPGLRVAVAQRVRLLEAEVREGLTGCGRLDDRDLRPFDEPVQRRCGGGVARIGEQPAAD